MNYPYGLLPDSWHWFAAVLYGLILLPALLTAPWQRFQRPETLHVFLGSCVALLTLMFGWQLALLAFSLVFLGMMFNGSSDWQSLPLNILVMGLVPILVSQAIYRLVDGKLPNHFFIYVFLNAFFGAGIAQITMIGVASGILIAGEVYSFDKLAHDYYPFIPLMIFPEGFITGMLISIMVAMTPNWVCTFDDLRYLNGK